MGHSTSSGRSSGGANTERTAADRTSAGNRDSWRTFGTGSEPFSQDRLNEHILVNRGEAITSRDIDHLTTDLENGASVGDRVESRENNRYYDITDTYTRTADGWRYQRVNHSNGQTYEDRSVSSRDVAREVLGTALSRTDPQRWSYRRK